MLKDDHLEACCRSLRKIVFLNSEQLQNTVRRAIEFSALNAYAYRVVQQVAMSSESHGSTNRQCIRGTKVRIEGLTSSGGWCLNVFVRRRIDILAIHLPPRVRLPPRVHFWMSRGSPQCQPQTALRQGNCSKIFIWERHPNSMSVALVKTRSNLW